MNFQGPDVGKRYRSIILYTSDAQRAAAEKIRAETQSRWSHPIVTEIVPLKHFYAAEDYHQDYFSKHPDESYWPIGSRTKSWGISKPAYEGKSAAEELESQAKINPVLLSVHTNISGCQALRCRIVPERSGFYNVRVVIVK